MVDRDSKSCGGSPTGDRELATCWWRVPSYQFRALLRIVMPLSKKVVVAALTLMSATVALAQAAVIQPGQWEMISTTKTVEMPNAPPQVTQMMEGRSSTLRRCITSKEAANGFREMVKSNKSCIFGHYAMSGGKYDAEMTCSQGGGTMTAVTTGTYTATTMSSTSRIMIKGPAPITITTSVVGKRVGAC